MPVSRLELQSRRFSFGRLLSVRLDNWLYEQNRACRLGLLVSTREDSTLFETLTESNKVALLSDTVVSRFSEQFNTRKPVSPAGKLVSLPREHNNFSSAPGLDRLMEDRLLFMKQINSLSAVVPVVEMLVRPPQLQSALYKEGRLFKFKAPPRKLNLKSIEVRLGRLFKDTDEMLEKTPEIVFKDCRLLKTRGFWSRKLQLSMLNLTNAGRLPS